jgi:RNA polymerase sigma-70 factor (ECF subfamily)
MFSPALNETDFDGNLQIAMQQARDGTTELLGQLLEAYRPYLLQIANDELDSNLRGKAGGSDLVQQTYLEANQDIAGFRGRSEAELIVWLRRILMHNLANFRRQFRTNGKRDIRREMPIGNGDSSGAGFGELPGEAPSPSDQALAREQDETLEQALARLPDDYRQAIVMRHQQHQSFAAIGAAMDRSADAARKLWARAIEALEMQLGRSSQSSAHR